MATAVTSEAPSRAPSSRAADALAQVRSRWAGMAGRIGLGVAAVGFLLIAVAWNGAAGLDYVQGQVPYLISGGVGGLGLIVLGAALIVAESNRRDRAALERQLQELTLVLGRLQGAAAATGGGTRTGEPADAGAVVAGRSSFHAPSCHLVEGRADGPLLSRAAAEDEGLTPCRVCNP